MTEEQEKSLNEASRAVTQKMFEENIPSLLDGMGRPAAIVILVDYSDNAVVLATTVPQVDMIPVLQVAAERLQAGAEQESYGGTDD